MRTKILHQHPDYDPHKFSKEMSAHKTKGALSYHEIQLLHSSHLNFHQCTKLEIRAH